MTWWALLVVVGLPLFLLLSGRRSDTRHVDFYRSYFSRSELERLAEQGNQTAKKALER